MTGAKDLLVRWQSHRQGRALAQETLNKFDNLVGATFGELQKKVAAGESTGDLVLDYVIASGSGRPEDDKRAERYRNLQAALLGHTGELILVVTKESPIDANSVEKMICGVLYDDKLILGTREKFHPCCLPTSAFVTEVVTNPEALERTRKALQEGGGPGAWVGNFLLAGLSPKEYFSGYEHSVAQVYVGNAAVRAWFKEHRADRVGYLSRVADVLGYRDNIKAAA